MPPNSTMAEQRDVVDDVPNGFGGAQDPSLSATSFQKERESSVCSVTEAGSSSSSSEDHDTSGSDEEEEHHNDEHSVNSFQSAQMDMEDCDLNSSNRSLESVDIDIAPAQKTTLQQSSGEPSSSKERKIQKGTSSTTNSKTLQRKDSPDAYKRDRPEPLKDDSVEQQPQEGGQLVPYEATRDDQDGEEELQMVSYDPLQHPPKHARTPSTSTCHHRRDSSSQSIYLKPVDPEEEERRRNEVDTAMEILEHMRRANLVMEFGPGVDLQACVFCLREQRGSTCTGQRIKKQKQPLHFLPKLRHEKQCLICHSPVCKKHWDDGFLHQQNVILCQDCAPLFDLDNLVECMNLNAHSNAESQRAQQEQHMRRLLILYDRALLALRHSSQSFDDTARSQLVTTKLHKEGLGIGSHVTNIASGVTGIAATAVFMTPMGPWLLLTSLALGGIATAAGSGSYFLERMCPSTRQAEQTIALASMVDSLLEATTILRQAQITGTLHGPAGALEEDDLTETEEEEEDCVEITAATGKRRISQTSLRDSSEKSDSERLLFLEEDKDQRLMITILKAKKDREERPKNPIQFVTKKINRIGKDRAEDRKHRRGKRDRLAANEQQQEKGVLGRAAFRVRRELNRAKDATEQVVTVTRAATTLAAVGLQAGGGGMVRKFSKTARGGMGKNPPQKTNNDDQEAETESKVKAGAPSKPAKDPGYVAARHGLGVVARSFFSAAAEEAGQSEIGSGKEIDSDKGGDKEELESEEDHKKESAVADRESSTPPKIPKIYVPVQDILVRIFVPPPTGNTDASNGAIVAEFRHRDVHFKLRASGRVMKTLKRIRKAKQGLKNRRKRLIANDSEDAEDDVPVDEEKGVFVKNARFLVKASLTVLRETARYAGGAFSAAIVCVETMELKEKVDKLRSKNGARCSNADKLDRLKRHVWENSGGFPDSVTLEWELFANPQGDIAEVGHLQQRSFCATMKHQVGAQTACVSVEELEGSAPHWSSCFEGERPDGSQANLPIIHDFISKDPASVVSKQANSTCYPPF